MLKVDVCPDVADSVERVGFQYSVTECVGPDSANDSENVVHCLRSQALLRLALRSGACIVCGVSAMMLMIAAGMSLWTAGALGCLTAMAGADVAIGLYERWAAKRLGVCDVPPNGSGPA
ncbi:phage holin family protein [Pseudomonas fluorescens]|uniref:phage holin family protein n=1 Tax=Pseudomonas fluorescens TaxID=294 RepID=UPI0020A5509A|nr:phage holin family protein [Pseudomonas fluorescens]